MGQAPQVLRQANILVAVTSPNDVLDKRSKRLLKTLIERYIADGQPVGSRTLSRTSGLELSPATVRNVMSDLEELGLIASPHTSAGRIPTAKGYRLFVDTMMTARRGRVEAPPLQASAPREIISGAAELLSNMSRFVGVVLTPRRAAEFQHVEFVRLSERRILLVLVALDGEVQNRVLSTEQDYTVSQLTQASNYLNTNFAGVAIAEVRRRLQSDMDHLRTEVAALMQEAVRFGEESAARVREQLVISGEHKLLDVGDFAADMDQLRRAFALFEEKAQLLQLLDLTMQADGVQIFIGGESGAVPTEALSIVSSPYEVDGQVVGTLGVIGPTRMPYRRVVQIVDITSHLVSKALSQNDSNNT